MRRIIVLALALMGLATMGTSRTAGAADTAAKLPELHAYPGASDRAGPTYRIRMKALGPGEHVLILDPGPPYIVFDLQPSKDGDVVEFSGVAAVGRHGAILKLKNGTATQAYTLVFARLTRSGVVALMTVSALSAGGYLAGQVARGPGPKIASIKATPAAGNPAQVDLEIDGSALATRGAAFYLVPVLPAPAPAPAGTLGPAASAEPVQPQWRSGSVIDVGSGFATHLSLSLAAPAVARWPTTWIKGSTWRISIVNPDGERATSDFNVS